ncbi:MAG: PIG-L family deacetylase [Balneolaceae bacterium]|nr:PIG-L family deacetylase [Balneolaceae bacterium]
MKLRSLILLLLFVPSLLFAQPETPVEEWTGKTVLLVGAHPDDDSYSHGTLAMLNDNGNDVHILLLTTGNVGTSDPDMTRHQLAKIRRQEQVDAMKELGLSEENYINLGYNDGMVEFADREEVVKRIVYHIRRLQPDVLMAFDPGWGYQTWHKADHRAAAYLAADAARAAEWHLIFPGQIIQDGLEPHTISEYLFYDSLDEAQNVHVDISDYADMKAQARAKYMSQFNRESFNDYKGPDPEDYTNGDEFVERMREIVFERGAVDGVPHEHFRYYRGIPDGIGERSYH